MLVEDTFQLTHIVLHDCMVHLSYVVFELIKLLAGFDNTLLELMSSFYVCILSFFLFTSVRHFCGIKEFLNL